MEKLISLKEHNKKGVIYAANYSIKDIVFENAESFVNNVSDWEMGVAKSACEALGRDHREDKVYERFRRFKDTQKISESELKELLDFYNYDFVINYKE